MLSDKDEYSEDYLSNLNLLFKPVEYITFEHIKHQFALKWPDPELLPPDFFPPPLAEKCLGQMIWVIVICTEPNNKRNKKHLTEIFSC